MPHRTKHRHRGKLLREADKPDRRLPFRDPRRFLIAFTAIILFCAFVFHARGADAPDARPKPIPVADVTRPAPVDFEKEILPVLKASCLACHNKAKPKAKLVLETPADIRKGGDSGPAVVPGHGADSLLLKAASHAVDPES